MTTETTKPKRLRKLKEGDVMAIPLGDGTYGFGQRCAGGDYAYFDLRSEVFLPIEKVVTAPVAFRVPTVTDSVKNAGWPVLGNLTPVGPLSQDESYRNQPVGSNQLYLIKGHKIAPATYDEVKDLEVMSVWFDHHVLERLQDHFAGRPNLEFESTRKIKVYDPQTGQELDPITKEPIKSVPRKLSAEETAKREAVLAARALAATKPATKATVAKIKELVAAYDQLIPLVRAQARDNAQLTLFIESVAAAMDQSKVMLSAEVNALLGREAVKGLREGLRETPGLLISIMPETGRQFVADVEKKMGRKFTDF